MSTSRLTMFVAPLALALTAAPALAHGPGRGGACRADLEARCSALATPPAPGPGDCVKALCGDLTPGSGAFVNCLLGLQPPVSSQCQQQLTDMQAKITAFQTACAGDVTQYCGNVTGGPWSTVQCLRQAVTNNQPVSPSCQALLAQHHRHRHHQQQDPNAGSGQ